MRTFPLLNVAKVAGITSAIFLALIGSRAIAQVTTATLYVSVIDTSGGVIPNAVVTVLHDATGTSMSKTTGEDGTASFTFLRVGTYAVKAEAPGFKAQETRGMELAAGQQVQQSFSMQVGSSTETIQVEASAPLINTVSSEQINSFESLKVRELPLARRNFANLLSLGTGVVSTGDSVRMNGVGRNGVAFSVDGTDAGGNPEGRASSGFGRPNLIDIMSIEAIQEVATVKGVPPAEYGNIVGGQVNLLSRSGTNTWHGSLFENFQAEELNARNQRLSNKPGSTFNQFGGSIGGPIIRNKLFAFGVYEGYRDRAFSVVQENVPTPRLRNDMLAGTPSYKLLLDYLPLPNQPYSATADVGLYREPRSTRRDDNHADVRTDWRITDLSNLTFSYSRGRPYQLVPRHYLNGSNDRDFRVWNERGTAAYTFTRTTWTSESRFGYNLADTGRFDRFFFEQKDPSNRKEVLPFGRSVPRIATNLGWSSPDHEYYLLEGRTINLDEKIALQRGKHGFKFGFSYRRDCCQKTNPEAPNINYTSRADLIANIPTEVAPVFGNGEYRGTQKSYGFFAQDDWRVRPDLTLNVGLRYDYFGAFHIEGKGNTLDTGLYNPNGLLNPVTFAVAPVKDRTNPIASDKWANLGPRFGFAYNPGGRGTTSIRGGFGILFSSQVTGALQAGVQPGASIPFRIRFSRADSQRLGLGWGTYSDEIAAIMQKDAADRGVTNVFSIYDPNLQNPYSMHYHFGIQRAITSTLALDTAFVGTRGVKFLMHRWANEPDRLTGIRPNPLLNVNYYVDNSQQSVYSSWQTSLKKRFSLGLTGSANYTWAKGLSTAGGDIGAYYQGDGDARTQQFLYPKADRGPNTGDITHYFNAEWVYEVPSVLGSNAIARRVLGGWQVSGIVQARTGEPVTLSQAGALQINRPDYVGGQVYLEDYRKTLQYLNRSAFALVPLGTVSRAPERPGNVGNGAIRAPGLVNVDLSFGKTFQLTERSRIQIRADMFNALNHTNLTGLRTSLNDAFFGQLLSTAGARVIQLNTRFSF
jgi:outer membrane receptor protein involved in Fe transport